MRIRMASLVLAGALVFPQWAEARKVRWVGTIASDRGIVLGVGGKLREIATGYWVGNLRCHPTGGVGRCLSKRLSVVVSLGAGTFTANIAGRGGLLCVATGSATATHVQGRYACGALDAGIFSLNGR